MVNLLYFLGLDINQKAEQVWQGKYIATRAESDYRILLYNLGEFYAEVFYNAKTNEIAHIKGFKAISNLAPYLGVKKEYDS